MPSADDWPDTEKGDRELTEYEQPPGKRDEPGEREQERRAP
jgi:hypothetical protein